MQAYITASGIISPQKTFMDTGFPDTMTEGISNRLTCIEPDYHGIINPVQLRRMPRILKMGLASARLCINRSAGKSPDAIIVGTGLGCLENLEKFLKEIIGNEEHITSVLPFINSTHNAVAAQIAMMLHNHGYNVTYCHRGMSFESALDDALLHLEEKTAQNVLIGGIDECTDDFMQIHGYLNYWKSPLNNLSLRHDKSPGTIAGEGSAFFMLSGESSLQGQPVLEGVHTVLTPGGKVTSEDIIQEINSFLFSHGTEKKEISLILAGINGDSYYDGVYYDLAHGYFDPAAGMAMYKHLCGEYYTSTSFALWLGSLILSGQNIPDEVVIKRPAGKKMDKLLIYNHSRNCEHSLILLSHGKI